VFAALVFATIAAVRPPMKPAKAPAHLPPPAMPAATSREHIVAGPYVQPASQNLASGLRVVWWSDAAGPGRLTWRSPDGRRGGVARSEQFSFGGWVRHTAVLPREDGDSASFAVSVTVDGKESATPGQSVSFAPRTGSGIRFAAVGDSGAGSSAQRAVAERILESGASLLLVAGDVVYGSGEWEEYKRNLFKPWGDLIAKVPVAPSLGNHDVGNPEHLGRPYRAVWTPPLNWQAPAKNGPDYTITRVRANNGNGPVSMGEAMGRNYSLDLGKCHIICLDSTVDGPTMRALVAPWARADLADARRRGQTWFVACWHHPPYTRGAYRDNSRQWQDVRDILVPVIREAGVQVVVNGHDHNYQHMEKDGVHYVISGAGGARLYDLKPDFDGAGQPPLLGYNDKVHSFTLFDLSPDARTLKVRQIAADGKTLDEWTVGR
jgi:hypothetical protein